jgi:molybdate transport system regulatory protein
MSYRRAWLLVDTMNQCFREPVVDTATGWQGRRRRADHCSSARRSLRVYRAMESGATASIAKTMPEFSRLLRKTPPAGKTY